MKEVELRLVAELMRNCRRSDRELAKALKVSQPTVSRMIKKLEREGILQNYSVFPDFEKIGFTIMAFTFAKLEEHEPEELQEARKEAAKMLNRYNSPAIIGMSGIGCDADKVLVTLHRNYSEFYNFQKFLRNQRLVLVDEIKNFTIDLTDKNQFLPLNLAALGGFILDKVNRS